MGRGSLYASFGDKHTVFIKALQEYVRQALIQTHEELDGPAGTAIDRLRAWILAGAGFVLRDGEHFGCMAGKLALEVGDQDTEARDVILGVFAEQQRVLSDCVAAAQRHGDLAPEADGCSIACMILALNRGMDVMAKGGISQATLDAAAEQAFRGLPLIEAYSRRQAG
ncbi:TetR family transcriptional regulator C-terminal domain-containing protein [Actinoplanes sp. NPDC026619]|uniref:TetR family transcriptional regulator C-terminal domain-containing protein n=1 Tax=Actinoplanes sp. NPDC026619 TaxID=3155798 RepID=UPI0033DF5CAA